MAVFICIIGSALAVCNRRRPDLHFYAAKLQALYAFGKR